MEIPYNAIGLTLMIASVLLFLFVRLINRKEEST